MTARGQSLDNSVTPLTSSWQCSWSGSLSLAKNGTDARRIVSPYFRHCYSLPVILTMLLVRILTRCEVHRWMVLRSPKRMVSSFRCKLQEKERRPFSQALLSKLVIGIQQESIVEILKQVQNDELLRFQNQQTLSYPSWFFRSPPYCHPELVSGSGLRSYERRLFPAYSGFMFFSAERFLAFLRKKDSWWVRSIWWDSRLWRNEELKPEALHLKKA